MPLLIYGAELKEEIKDVTIENFTSLIDPDSWEEFMPKGVSKIVFSHFRKYYDPDIFLEAGRRIRAKAEAADKMTVEQRIERITGLFANFRNPDKETVLTPWRVVNMHLGDTLGGYNFYNEDYTEPIEEPRCVEHGSITAEVFNPNSHILEINSKTGLYPLYVAYSLYRASVKNELTSPETVEEQQAIWDKVLRDNVFVICKTKMAKSITKRTLVGFRNAKTNTYVFDDLLNQIANNQTELIERINKGYIFKNFKNMKFNAIVGNPPYQLMGGSGGTNDAPIYQGFCQMASSLKSDFISMIIPAKWFTGGRESLLGKFRQYMLTSGKIKKLYTYPNSKDLFPTVEIKGGVCYYLEKLSYNGLCQYHYIVDGEDDCSNISLNDFDVFIRNPRIAGILRKVQKLRVNFGEDTVDSIVSADTPFGIPTNPKDSKKKNFILSEIRTPQYDIELHYLENGRRTIGYIKRSDIIKNTKDIDSVKVFIPGAGGSGNDQMVLGKPILAPRESICSQTYLYVKFDSEVSAKNFIAYLQTKFFRFLVSAMKITQHAQASVYQFVPIQDWSKIWTDTELYAKYDLNKEEIAFIESAIKPME